MTGPSDDANRAAQRRASVINARAGVDPSGRLVSLWASRSLERWMLWAARRPWLALGLLAALTIASLGASAAFLRVDTDTSKMLSRDLPFQDDLQRLREAYPELKSTIAIVIEAPSADGADAVATELVERLTPQTDLYTTVFSASIDPFFQANGILYGEMAAVEERVAALSGAASFVSFLRADQSVETFLRTLLLAQEQASASGGPAPGLDALHREAAAVFAAHADGDRRAFGWSGALNPSGVDGPALRIVSLQPKLDFMRLNAAKAPLEAALAEIERLPEALTAGVRIGVTGEPALRADELNSVVSNLALSLAISLLAVALALRWACRSTPRALLALGALITTLILTTGAAAIAATPLNLVSVAFVVLMVGLGIDYAIHLLLHLEENGGAKPAAALTASGRALGGPLFLSAATTTLSFLAFTTTDFVGMAQLGLIGGIGALIAFAVTATLIPAIVSLKPTLLAAGARSARAVAARRPAGPARGALLAMLGAAVGAAAIVVAPMARFEADPMALRAPDAPSVVAFERLFGSELQSPYRLSVVARDAEDAAETAARLNELETVGSARWIGDFVAENQEDKLLFLDFALPSIEYAVTSKPEPIARKLPISLRIVAARFSNGGPAEQELAAALSAYADSGAHGGEALEADLFRHFPAFVDRLAAILGAGAHGAEDLPTALRDLFISADGALRVEISPAEDLRDEAALRAFISEVSAAEPRVTGGPVVIDAAAQTVTSAMLQAAALSLTATALLAWAALGRLLLVAAIIAPLIVAGAITAAASVVLQTPFNYANVIVLPLLIGIGVDSGVHLAMRGASMRGQQRAGASEDVFATSTPRAIVFSAVTTIAAFGSLALSDHRGTSSMGVMLAIGLGAALFAVMTLTPALVRLAEPRPAPQRAGSSSAAERPRPSRPTRPVEFIDPAGAGQAPPLPAGRPEPRSEPSVVKIKGVKRAGGAPDSGRARRWETSR